jgi:ribosome-associated translation inhibitor RaiA
MRNPVEITLRGVPHSGALERYVGEQARQLDRQCDRIHACHVVVEALHRPKQQDAQFAVRLNITLPGTEVVVNREHGEDVYIAVRDAFEAAGLQLKDHMRRLGNVERRSHNGTSDPGI